MEISWIVVGCGPFPVTVANKGLVQDSLLKMFHNPGGHWNPGKGPYPRVLFFFFFFVVVVVVVVCFFSLHRQPPCDSRDVAASTGLS